MELDQQHFSVTSYSWEHSNSTFFLLSLSSSFSSLIRISSFLFLENHNYFQSLHFVYFFSLSISHSSNTIDAVLMFEDMSSMEKSDSLRFIGIIPAFIVSSFYPVTLFSQSYRISSQLCKILSLLDLIKLNLVLWSSAISWRVFS